MVEKKFLASLAAKPLDNILKGPSDDKSDSVAELL